MKSKKCTRCFGKGFNIPLHSFAKDKVECDFCKGSGLLPKGYVPKRLGGKPRVFKRNDGMEDLKNVEAV